MEISRRLIDLLSLFGHNQPFFPQLFNPLLADFSSQHRSSIIKMSSRTQVLTAALAVVQLAKAQDAQPSAVIPLELPVPLIAGVGEDWPLPTGILPAEVISVVSIHGNTGHMLRSAFSAFEQSAKSNCRMKKRSTWNLTLMMRSSLWSTARPPM